MRPAIQPPPEHVEWLASLKPGDKVTRLLAGKVPMPMVISDINDLILCTFSTEGNYPSGLVWAFHKQTGCEVDNRFGWDGVYMTGSYLIPPKDQS